MSRLIAVLILGITLSTGYMCVKEAYAADNTKTAGSVQNTFIQEHFSTAEQSTDSTGNMIWTIGRMVMSLLLIIGLIYGSVFLMGKMQRKGGFASSQLSQMRIIERLHLSPKKTVYLVKVPGKALVLAAGNEEIRLLTELDVDKVDEKLSAEKLQESLRNLFRKPQKSGG